MDKKPNYTINDLVQLRQDYRYWLVIDTKKKFHPDWNYQQIIDSIKQEHGNYFKKEIENDKILKEFNKVA